MSHVRPPSEISKQLRAEDRRREVVRLISQGVPLNEIARRLGVSYITVRRDKEILMDLSKKENKSEMQLFRDDQLARITAKWNEIENDPGMTSAEKHLAWSRWMKLEIDLRGTAAPTKSIAGHVDLNPEHSDEYLLDREAMAGLSDEQRHEVRVFAKSLPRQWEPTPIESFFTKALPEGDDREVS